MTPPAKINIAQIAQTSLRSVLHRRTFLRAAGVAMALPLLDIMKPAFAADPKPSTVPRRMIAICNNLGLLNDRFFPAQAGRDYKLTPYLEVIKEHRQDFTPISGTWHPYVDGGHPADNCFLTAAPHPGNASFRNTISLDQYIAQYIGHLTRFPSLTLGVNIGGQRSLSWTPAGVMIPCEQKAAALYKKLFIDGTKQEIAAQKRRLAAGQSIMDAIGDQARGLGRQVSARDRERLDQYFTSVRDLEQRMDKAKAWEDVPKPHVDAKMPTDPNESRQYMARTKLMYDMSALAIQTDSTRNITIMLDSVASPAIEIEGAEIKDGYHSLSHNGKNKAKLDQLDAIDKAHMKLLGDLMSNLKGKKEDGQSLLDRTMILYGSNMGNANTHVTTNLPILFMGGGFKHGQHLAFDKDHNYPLPNLFVSMLQRFGLQVDAFASSTGTMTGLGFA